MREALRLARRGAGKVLPNPMVGAVVVRDGAIIGKGYHREFGGPHAEVFALDEAGEAARGATLYVTLEPCSYFGKTPPCTEAIIQAKIRRVVVATNDPNPRVNGRGLEMLRRAGIQVETGILQDEAIALNRPFSKFIRTGLPYITLKLAQTADGKLADQQGASRWITGPPARRLVHRLRAEAGAVLVGSGTVLRDDPALTVRHVKGPQPWRIILDRRLRIPLSAQLLSDDVVEKTIVVTVESKLATRKAQRILHRGARVLAVTQKNDGASWIEAVLQHLGKLQICHVLVEGGQKVASAFLTAHCVDSLMLFIAPKIFGRGKDALHVTGFSAESPLRLVHLKYRKVGEDLLLEADLENWFAARESTKSVRCLQD